MGEPLAIGDEISQRTRSRVGGGWHHPQRGARALADRGGIWENRSMIGDGRDHSGPSPDLPIGRGAKW
jgi:hypothetical protein